MVLLDSNIFIYLANGSLKRKLLEKEDIGYASISKIETLGFSDLQANEQLLLKSLFDEAYPFALTDSIIDLAINLRQLRKLSLGDSIVAATALQSDLALWTANVSDFYKIDGLKLHNPLRS